MITLCRPVATAIALTAASAMLSTRARAQSVRPCPLCALPTISDSMLPPGTGAIIGVVTDTAHGQPESGVVRLVREHVDARQDKGVANSSLQHHGGFVLRAVPAGRYDLFVFVYGADGFTIPSITVGAGHVDTLTIRVTNTLWPHSPGAL
jgi:hypothetical protein